MGLPHWYQTPNSPSVDFTVLFALLTSLFFSNTQMLYFPAIGTLTVSFSQPQWAKTLSLLPKSLGASRLLRSRQTLEFLVETVSSRAVLPSLTEPHGVLPGPLKVSPVFHYIPSLSSKKVSQAVLSFNLPLLHKGLHRHLSSVVSCGLPAQICTEFPELFS